MKLFMLLAALMGTGLVQAAPANAATTEVLQAQNKTYNIIDINWTIQINNTASPYNLAVTGTIQDVFSQLTKVDAQAADALKQAMSGQLQDRDASSKPTNTTCNIFNKDASAGIIKQGISYLRGIPGRPSNGPGPGNCGRVSCSYNSAIYWCNDNKETKVLDSFGQIADGAQLTLDTCVTNRRHSPHYNFYNGQQFFDDGWNVIVTRDSC